MKVLNNPKTFLARVGLILIKSVSLIALSATISAQYRSDFWTTENGLPQNSVTGLTQTPDGYIWLTTNDGLVRFDGVRFTVFNTANSPELPTNRLAGAFADKRGRLWFQCEDSSIGFYEKGYFSIILKPGEIVSNRYSPFFDDQNGGVIFAVPGKIYRYENGKFVPFHFDGLADNSAIILADRTGGLWFSNEKSIQRLRDGTLKTFDLSEFGGNNSVYKIGYEDREGGIWLGYAGDFDQPNDFKLLRIKDDKIQKIDFPATPVWHFAEDREGNLWFTVFERGIYRIAREILESGAPITIPSEPVVSNLSISTNSSGLLLPDSEGGMWIGTEKGLVRLLPQTIKVYSKQNGLPEDNVYPIFQDAAGGIFAGIWNNSLVKYENGAFKTILSDKNSANVSSLFEDSKKRLWFGNTDILRYLENGKLTEFNRQAGFKGYAQFSVITEDRSGNLWFGTDQGLSRFKDGKATVFTVQEGLPDNYIVALLESADGKLWIGTRGGLASFENGKFTSFTKKDGLASNYIRSLYEDAEGVLWIGSYDGGLTRFKDGKFFRFTKKDGLSSDGVFCILEDGRNWFWINSNQGIYRVSRQELNDFADGRIKSLTSIAYNKSDGLINIEGNGGRQPAGIKARDGQLWFPTAEGIAVINPEKVIMNSIAPPVLIEDILIDRNQVSNEIFQLAVGDSESAITLSPDENSLEISYTGLSFINSEQVKFKYKLEGLDDDWIDAGTRRTAYYSYLPAGDYKFRVVAANRDGVWNSNDAQIRVKVLPPFYRTWWFSAFVLLVFLGAVYIIYRLRVRQLKNKAFLQEEFARQLIDSQELERGRIAADLHDGLSQSLVIIKNRAMLSLSKPEDHERIIEQLREIADASTYAIDEVKEIIYDLRPIQLDRLGLTGAITEMAEKVCEANDLCLKKRIDDIDNVFPKQSENSIYRIVQESLNNVIKHSGADTVELKITLAEMQCRLIIADNGKGFSLENVRRTDNKKNGFGLIGITERAKLLGGIASIESGYEIGTKVSIVLPVASNRVKEF